LLDISDENKRKQFISEYTQTRKENIEWDFYKFPE
jgi:hypothetical protein